MSYVTRFMPALLALGLVACGNDDGGGNPSPKPELDFSAFDRAIESFLVENQLEGATAVVVHKDWGIVHEHGYGVFDAKRISLIASSSKILSVGILMRLADQGLLDLDKPISNYLSQWGTYKSDITTAQLVSNSSGLVGLIDNPIYAPYICQYLPNGTLSDCAKTVYTADDAADRVPPDTKFRYGGGPWQLAGGIAEVVSGKLWPDLIAETYGEPCNTPGIGYTNVFAKATADGGLAGALSYPKFFHGDVSTLDKTQNPSIEGGAYTTPAEYGRILLMHLRGGTCDGGRVLSQAAVQRMQKDRIGEVYGGSTINPNMQGYGLGWWVDRKNPGVVSDAGAYGAVPWLDGPRAYGALLIIEATSALGVQLQTVTKPLLDEVFDAANEAQL